MIHRREVQKWLLVFAFAFLPFLGTALIRSPQFNSLTGNSVVSVASGLPYLLFLVAVYLAWKINQFRIVYFAAVMILSYWLFSIRHSGWVGKELAITLPLTGLLISAMKETSPLGKRMFFQLSAALFPTLFGYWLYLWKPGVMDRLFAWKLIGAGSHHWLLPQLSLILIILSLVLVVVVRTEALVQLSTYWQFFEGFLVSLISVLSVLEYWKIGSIVPAGERLGVALGFIGSGLIFLYMLLQLFWQKIYMDTLTGVMNRRAFDEKMQQLGSFYTLAMVDVDHFKSFNDKYGHDVGDQVLRLVGSFFRKSVGNYGTVYRYGGEEFCVVFENFSVQQVHKLLDQIRNSMASRKFHVRRGDKERIQTNWVQRGRLGSKGKTARVTVSIGASDRHPLRDVDPEQVLKEADTALYKAKDRGRNRVVIKE